MVLLLKLKTGRYVAPSWMQSSPEQRLKRRQALLGLDKFRNKQEVTYGPDGKEVSDSAVGPINLSTPLNLQLMTQNPPGQPMVQPASSKKSKGLAGLVTQPKTTVAEKKPAVKPTQPYSISGSPVRIEDVYNQDARSVLNLIGLGDRFGGGTLRDVNLPNIKKDTDRLTTEISQDPRFDANAIRRRNENAIKQTVGELRNNIESREGIQEAGYEEESVAMDTFLNNQIESIKEDGATTSDIMAEAIDQGMKEPTIVTMLTKVLNTNEKGVKKRAREVRKELRDLKKTRIYYKKRK